MNGKKKTTEEAEIDEDSPDGFDTEREDTIDALEDIVKAPQESPSYEQNHAGKRWSGAVAWLALLVSIVAIAAVAYDLMRVRNAAGDAAQNSAEVSSLRSSLGASQDALATLEQSIAALGSDDEEQSERLDRINNQLNERLLQLESLPGRLSSIESSMAALQGISTGARSAWLLAEAEYYMQIANAQLQLANNPQLASLALTHADDRVLQLGDPRLTNVRQALSNELRALKGINKPDIAGITLTLASLAGAVDSLPLRQEVVVREDKATEIDPELSGMERAMQSLKNAVGGVVSVRRADEAMQPLIAPEAQYFLRANLALQLQAARLALLRGEEGVFRQNLDDVDSWIEKYYDPASTAVQDARKTIAEIRDSVFSVSLPDISQSLRLLRQFKALAESSQADDTGLEQ